VLSLAKLDAAGNVVANGRVIFPRTFWLQDHGNAYRVAPVAIPRAHGDRLPDETYLGGKTITLQGTIGSGTASGEIGTPGRTSSGGQVLGYVADSTLADKWLLEVRTLFGRLHNGQTAILDYGNGWFQYVRVQQISSQLEEGWPSIRRVTLTLYAADPLAYSTTLLSIDTSQGGTVPAAIQPFVDGNAPSFNWVLTMAQPSNVTTERAVLLTQDTDRTGGVVILPAGSAGPLVINGYLHTVTVGGAPAWSRWQSGGEFPPLPGNSDVLTLAFRDPNTLALLTFGTDLTVTFNARGADWLADSMGVPTVGTGSEYGTGEYGIAVYGG